MHACRALSCYRGSHFGWPLACCCSLFAERPSHMRFPVRRKRKKKEMSCQKGVAVPLVIFVTASVFLSHHQQDSIWGEEKKMPFGQTCVMRVMEKMLSHETFLPFSFMNKFALFSLICASLKTYIHAWRRHISEN